MTATKSITCLILAALVGVGVWSVVGAMYAYADQVDPRLVEGAQQQASSTGVAIQADESDSVAGYVDGLVLFYSPTCPHCHKEQKFLDVLEKKYPALDVQRYNVDNRENIPHMIEIAAGYEGAERSLGNVPLTFVGAEYIVGYDSDETSGAEIEAAVRTVLGLEHDGATSTTHLLNVPILGAVDPSEYSLPLLAVLLGFLDGFNICSLGALVLIIGLTLKLQRRRAILFFGGTFIVTTALVYGALIVLWYKVFDIFTAYVSMLKVLIVLLSLGGGAYFLKEYFRMRSQGAVCQLQESPFIARLSEHTSRAFEHPGRLLSVFGAVLVFAAVVAIVEFPCSAAVPVVFAGILADTGMSTLAYLLHIGLFVIFYLLDELIIFGIAAYKLKLWMLNGTFTKWAVLAEGVILFAIGLFYALGMLGLL